MARIWTGEELGRHVAALRGRRLAVIGYGNQGRAQALNLRDTGLKVTVGNTDDAYAASAGADGFEVAPIAEAAAHGEILLVLLPDEVQPGVFEHEILPALSPGRTVSFASGYTVAFGLVRPPEGVDVCLVAPRMIGRGIRQLALEGRGFPVLVGAEANASGRALETALGIAAGIGAGGAGGCAVESSFREEATIDLFSEHTWAAATVALLGACCETLIEAGVSPEAAILETYASGEIGEIGRAIAELGLVEQLALHSTTSQYGHLTRGPEYVGEQVRAKLRRALAEIQDDSFAREWTAEQRAGLPRFRELLRRARAAPFLQQEDSLYRRLGRRGEGAERQGTT